MEEKQEKDIKPEVNIGLIGHVDHGKTTLVRALTGKWTDTHSEEIKKGITIRLGYADAIFRKCEKCNYYTVEETCKKCGGKTKILRMVSFVDAPGHESLMATMLSGAAIMDGALLLIAANEECPQPQTKEHLMALQLIGIKNVVVVQNKIDLVDEETAIKNYKQIKEFLKGTDYENAPIIPVSAQHSANIDLLIEAIEKTIPTPKRDPTKDPFMLVARSFDINKPGIDINKLAGGILGGTLKQGLFKVGDEIEIKPGIELEEKNRKIWKPLKTRIVSLVTGNRQVNEVGPAGLIAIQTLLDPSIVKSDQLAGSVVGKPGRLPPILHELTLDVKLLERVVGTKEELAVEEIKINEVLLLNVYSTATVGIVSEIKGKDKIKCILKRPVCAEKGARVTISRRIGNRFRLIGYGIIV